MIDLRLLVHINYARQEMLFKAISTSVFWQLLRNRNILRK